MTLVPRDFAPLKPDLPAESKLRLGADAEVETSPKNEPIEQVAPTVVQDGLGAQIVALVKMT